MHIQFSIRPVLLLLLAGATVTCTTGCQTWRVAKDGYQTPGPVRGLGTINDQIFQLHEENSEASEFIVYDHEFNLHTAVLNTAGRDHVKQIAARCQQGQPFQVLVERSMNTVRESSKYKYPVNPNPALDMRRREVVVYALNAMGVENAEQIVVVAPAPNEGLDAQEASQAQQRLGFGGFGGLGGFGRGFGGFGGGFGGFGGGFGGFGGGFGGGFF